MVSAEMAPFAKVGGLADVTESLSRILAKRGHDVRVVLPLYGGLDRKKLGIKVLKKIPPLSIRVGQVVHPLRIHMLGSANASVKIYLLESPLFDRTGIYTDRGGDGFEDSLSRSSLHTQAALMLPRVLDWPVDIVHAHDAASAPAAVLRRQWYGKELPGPGATVLTIHNLAHQETHPQSEIGELGLPSALASYPGLMEFHGQINLMKGGILAADQVTTVSPGYAEETRTLVEYGCGLEEILDGRGQDYSGILNGGDYQTWDPSRDKALPANFSASKMQGKDICRKALLKELKLKAVDGRPLAGFVSRLVSQKGVNILLPLLDRLAEDGFTFALLGTGERRLEKAVKDVARRHPGKVAFVDAFDEGLAHRIYAGSDLFLMPSAFEPCGLSQMYALRYGTPPVVRRTGGLADTVVDFAKKKGTGFVFDEPRPEALMAALRRAEAIFSQPEKWRSLQRQGMRCDFSWDVAAGRYEEVYRKALKKH